MFRLYPVRTAVYAQESNHTPGQRQRARRPSRVAIPTMLEGEAAYIALSVAISSAVSANEESARSSAMYTGFSPGLVVI